jgi:16S rRNA (cytosine967-C5)-methyltransferase
MIFWSLAIASLVFNTRTTAFINAVAIHRKSVVALSMRGKTVVVASTASLTKGSNHSDPNSNGEWTSTKSLGKDAPPKSVKKIVRPTARYVAISALANAAASARPLATMKSEENETADETPSYSSYASRELEQSSHYQSLDARDRSFARLLVATVERRHGQIDKVIQSCVTKPIKGKHLHVVQATLRVGVAQLLFLQTPPFAAIKETVEVLKMTTHPITIPEPMIKFANGVLRNLSRPLASTSTAEHEANNNDKINSTDGEMRALKFLREKTSPRDNIAPWLLQRWKRDWGEEMADLICKEMMPEEDITTLSTPRTDLSTIYSLRAAIGVNENSKSELQSLMTNLGDDTILLPQCSIRIGPSRKGDVKLWPGYEDGTWWVQDASATLPAMVLTQALLDRNAHLQPSDMHVIDMCSAPGGKAMQLVSAGFGLVTAIEASKRRSLRLVENLKRLNMLDKCQVVVEEGQNWTPARDETQPVHGILLDVPCSATGTGARRPDVLRKSADTLTELIRTQEVLANHCVDNILDLGGVLVYATCSVLKEESEDQVQKLIDRGNVESLPIQPNEVPGFEDAIDSHGWIRVLPGVLGGNLRSTDGFFVARLIKK